MEVLIIDDDIMILELMTISLKERNYKLTTAQDAETALEYCHNTYFPMIIVDIGLPKMNGLEFCMRLRKLPNGKYSYILMNTGMAEPEYLKKALDAGADDYLIKPNKYELLSIRLDISEHIIKNRNKRFKAEEEIRIREKELKETRHRLTTILDSMKEVIFYFDSEYRIQWLNRSATELLKTEAKDITGKKCYEVLKKDKNHCKVCPLKNINNNETHIIHEMQVQDESIFRLKSYPIRNDNNRIINWVVVGLDISDEIFRYEVKDFLNRISDIFFSSTNLQDIYTELMDIFISRFEKFEKDKNIPEEKILDIDENSHNEYHECMLKGPHAKGTFAEVEERKFITAILDNASALIVVLDRNGHIIRFNKAFESLSGYTLKELYGYIFWEKLLKSDDAEYMRSNIDLIHDTAQMTFENTLQTKNGKNKYISWSKTTIKSISGDFSNIVAIGTDITDKKKAEREVKLSQLQLMQADKMAALGTIVSGVAHEINNPNNFILINTPLIIEAWEDIFPILDKYYTTNGDFDIGGLPYSEMKEYISVLFSGIVKGSKRIKKIVNELKNYSRPDLSDMQESVDINEVVKNCITLNNSLINKSTRHFSVKYEEDIPSFNGNFQRIEQVVINLLQNACQALQDKSKGVTVSTSYKKTQNRIVLTVKDEGIGISDKSLSFIMNPFYTTKRTSGGTGLGLSVTSKIIKEHGGIIEVDSKKGVGTTFNVLIPLR
ncbi:histidine kinase [Candidatus Magnetomorum sp. HK-1]|nr:histidine kinase [Candidatus Magnetomorum sp. HK-1]